MSAAVKPDDDFPSSNAVLIRTAPTVELQSPADIQRIMLQLDEQQFMAEVMGEALEKWFYSFRIAGKMMEGVSAKGAHEFARIRAEQGFFIRFPVDGIRLEEVTENGELGARAIVIARDGRTHAEAIGVAFYPYMSARTDGSKEFDRFAGRKAMSVAERNAILRLIPEKTVLSALKVRAKIVAANELQREAEARLAEERRPVLAPVVAGSQPQKDPYDGKPVAALAKPRAPQDTHASGPMTLSQAKLLPLMGKVESWNNHGTKTLNEVPDAILRQARAFFTDKLKSAASPRMEGQLEAIALVLADREANSPQAALALAQPAETDDEHTARVLADEDDDDLPF